jgi:hypothetical protein
MASQGLLGAALILLLLATECRQARSVLAFFPA